MTNKFIRIAQLLEKKHKATLAELQRQDNSLLEQLDQVDMLNKHSQTIVNFSPDEEVAAIDFKQAMYYRENLNTLLVAQYREISDQRKSIRGKEQETQKQLQNTAILSKLGEKQTVNENQVRETKELDELNASVLLRKPQNGFWG